MVAALDNRFTQSMNRHSSYLTNFLLNICLTNEICVYRALTRLCTRFLFSRSFFSKHWFIYLSLPLVVFRYSNNFQEIPFSRLHVAKSSIQRLLMFAFFLSFYVVSFIQVFRIHICNSLANYEQYDYYCRKSLLWNETNRIIWKPIDCWILSLSQNDQQYSFGRKLSMTTANEIFVHISDKAYLQYLWASNETMSSYDWFFCLFSVFFPFYYSILNTDFPCDSIRFVPFTNFQSYDPMMEIFINRWTNSSLYFVTYSLYDITIKESLLKWISANVVEMRYMFLRFFCIS